MTTLTKNTAIVGLAAEITSPTADNTVLTASSRPIPSRATTCRVSKVDTIVAATQNGGIRPAAPRLWPKDNRMDGQATPSIESGSAMLKKAR